MAEVELDTETNTDPFREDDLFAPLDTRTTPEENRDARLQALADIANENPEFAPPPDDEPLDPRVARPEDVQPASVVEVPQPQVTEFEDGSSVTVEHTNRGWKATLATGVQGVQPEVFYGKTKEEMWSNVAAGKIHATRKIRDLNRKVKLHVNEPTPAPRPTPRPATPTQTQPKVLTADEKFEIKTKLESDPEAAFDLYFQKKYGLSAEQLLNISKLPQLQKDAEAGRRASQELELESVAKAFVAGHPEYYSDDENYTAIVSFLAKEHLRTRLTNNNQDEVMSQLLSDGFWTVENLEVAFEELSEAGLLNMAPEEEEIETPAPVTPVTPAATPVPDKRIANRIVRPRAGQGLRQTQTTVVPTTVQRPPSVEELDNLSDDAVNELWNGVRRTRVQSARR